MQLYNLHMDWLLMAVSKATIITINYMYPRPQFPSEEWLHIVGLLMKLILKMIMDRFCESAKLFFHIKQNFMYIISFL